MPLSQIRRGWSQWIAFGKRVGAMITNVLLWVFYFTFFAPVGAIYSRMLRKEHYGDNETTYFSTDVTSVVNGIEGAREP